MGMPITVDIADPFASQKNIERVFSYFKYIDEKFSTYKDTSEISLINSGRLGEYEYSDDMNTVFRLSEETKQNTDGYFDIVMPDGKFDPSGLVKGWSIYNAARILNADGLKEFYIDAGGDIQANGKFWKVGIKNPFDQNQIVKVLYTKDRGIATSGTYIRGQHIHNPREKGKPISEVVSLTVIGHNIYEADRYTTAAFAMGQKGIEFIEKLDGFEGYVIDKDGFATMTSGFEAYTREPRDA